MGRFRGKSNICYGGTDNSLNMNANTLDDISKNKLNNASAAFAQLGRTIEVQFIAPLAEKATPYYTRHK